MAVNLKHEDGSKTVIFPSHDPDKQDEGLALELAVDRTRDGVIDAARQARIILGSLHGQTVVTTLGGPRELRHELDVSQYLIPLDAALDAYDAAVAEHRAHDDRVQPEPPPPTWNERRGVLLDEVNRTHFLLLRDKSSLAGFVAMGADPAIIADQEAEVERRRAAWQAAMQRYKDERPADAEPQP